MDEEAKSETREDGGAADRFGPFGILLHWTVALLVLFQLGSALAMEGMERELRGTVMGLHKAAGLTVVALTIARILWRRSTTLPDWPESVGAARRRLLHRVELAIYALLLVVPLAGWGTSMAAGHATSWFGLFTIPAFLPESETLAEVLGEVHEIGAFGLMAVVGLHAGLVVWEASTTSPGFLRRMLPPGVG